MATEDIGSIHVYEFAPDSWMPEEGDVDYLQFTGVVVEKNAAVSLSVTVANEILYGVAAGSGLVFAVGGNSSVYEGTAPIGEPIVYMTCD